MPGDSENQDDLPLPDDHHQGGTGIPSTSDSDSIKHPENAAIIFTDVRNRLVYPRCLHPHLN